MFCNIIQYDLIYAALQLKTPLKGPGKCFDERFERLPLVLKNKKKLKCIRKSVDKYFH